MTFDVKSLVNPACRYVVLVMVHLISSRISPAHAQSGVLSLSVEIVGERMQRTGAFPGSSSAQLSRRNSRQRAGLSRDGRVSKASTDSRTAALLKQKLCGCVARRSFDVCRSLLWRRLKSIARSGVGGEVSRAALLPVFVAYSVLSRGSAGADVGGCRTGMRCPSRVEEVRTGTCTVQYSVGLM